MSVSNVPGYAQGFIFANSPAYYDSANNRFLDQSPFAGWANNHLQITVGTPTFDTLGTGQGVVLNNTVQGLFVAPALWHGSCIVVMRPNFTGGGTANAYPVLFGWATSVSSNSQIRLGFFSGNYSHNFSLNGGTSQANAGNAGNVPRVSAFSFSQQNRRVYATPDGSSIVTGAAVSDTGAGISGFGNGTPNGVNGLYARFGNVSGVIGDTAVSANALVMAELHFFRGDAINSHAAQLAAAIAALKAKYGI